MSRSAAPAPAIDLDALSVFVAVVETCSFTRGAARVFRTQPVASARVAQLEHALGTKLLERSGRSVRSTRSGETLYGYAKRILALRDEAAGAMARGRGELQGDLAVGASTLPAAYLVPAWAARFHRKHPRVRLRIGAASTEDVLRRVREGECELGVSGDRDALADLSFAAVASDEIVLAVPKKHPLAGRGALAPEALKGQPFVLRSAGSGTRSFVERALKRAGLSASRDFDVVCEVSSTEAAREAVKAGVGLSFVSSLAVACDAAAGRLSVRRLAGIDMKRPFYLVRSRSRKPTAAARAFADFIRTK